MRSPRNAESVGVDPAPAVGVDRTVGVVRYRGAGHDDIQNPPETYSPPMAVGFVEDCHPDRPGQNRKPSTVDTPSLPPYIPARRGRGAETIECRDLPRLVVGHLGDQRVGHAEPALPARRSQRLGRPRRRS
jgi:hypothetical protein